MLGKAEHTRSDILRDHKIRILFHSEDLSLSEVPILNLLIDASQTEDFRVLYLHTKGVTKPDNRNVADWLDYMLYFNVHLYRFALQALEYNDCCGVNYQDRHYSGNFWWSKSEYIRDLDKLSLSADRDYLAPEMWLTCRGLENNARRTACTPVSLWTSGVNHYDAPYPRSRYADGVRTYDVRFKRLLPHFDHVVINNYECGLSSSRWLPTQPVLRISAKDKVILFYRNIFLRAIGTFIKGCAADNRVSRREGSLMREIEDVLGEADYRHLRAIIASRDFPNAFRVYIGALKEAYARSWRALPQARLLEGYDIDHVDYFVELEHNLAFFRITNCRFPFDADSKSNRAIKESLMLLVRGNASCRIPYAASTWTT